MENTTITTKSNKKVLIIEDERAMAKAMELKLKKSGVDTLAVLRGEEGLDELSKGGYSLVLLDIMMPGMDGWDVMSKIKEKGINVKVIIASNLSQAEDKQKAKDLGAVGFLVKSDSTLASIVKEVMSHL